MPLIRVKSNIIVNGQIVEPGTYQKEELGNADFNYLISKGLVELAGDRPWDVMLPDEPTPENYVEEIERMQGVIEGLHKQVESLTADLAAKNIELRKAGDNRPLNRFHAPEANELKAAQEDALYWKNTAEQRAKDLTAARERNDRYTEQLGSSGPVDPDREPRSTDAPIPTVDGTQAPVVDADTIGTSGGGTPIRATTKKAGTVPTRPHR